MLALGAITVAVIGILDRIAGLFSGHAGRLAQMAQCAGCLNRIAAAVYAALGLRPAFE